MFLITGLQARTLHRLAFATIRCAELAMAAAVVCAVVIVTRFIWMFPATYLPRWLVPAIRRNDPSPPWQHPFAARVHRHSRHRLARRGARDPVHRR